MMHVKCNASSLAKDTDFSKNWKQVCDFFLVIATSVLSYTISNIWQLNGGKVSLYSIGPSFNTVVQGEPFQIL